MNNNDIFQKMVRGEELSKEEKIEASKWLLPKTDILPLNEISAEEKIAIARDIISEKVADILQKQMMISRLSWRSIDITLGAKECIDSDENIKKFLSILWANNIKITSDFPGYCESYEWTTSIKFNFN